MKLRYTSEAATELARTLDGITGHSPLGAHRVQSRIFKAIDSFIEHPYSGQRTSHLTMRRIIVRPYPYLIYYRIVDAELVIVGIRHAAQDPASTPDVR